MTLWRAALGGALLAIGAVCAEPPKPKPPPATLRAVTLDKALSGYTCAGGPGDLLIQLGPLRAVVATAEDSAERRMLRGSVIDAVIGKWEENALAEQRTVVTLNDVELPAPVLAVEPVTVDGRQAVRVLQKVKSPALTITTQIAATEPGPHLAIASEVESESAVKNLRVGDRVRWHGAHPFLPGTGYVDRKIRVVAPWLGHDGHPLSYAFVPAATTATVEVRTEREDVIEQLVLGAPVALEAGGKHRARRHLLLARGDLGAVAELAWMLAGRDYTVARGLIEGAGDRSTLTARDGAGRVALSVRTSAGGSWSMPLPLGSYRLTLHAPGGEDEAALEVTRDGATLSEPLAAPAPGELRVLVTDENGAPIAARIQVRGIAPTADPNFGDEQLAKGYANVAYTLGGDARLTLPPGGYRIIVTHGPERTLVSREVRIDAALGATVRARLARVVDTTGWLACDLHVHAAPSFDSRVPLVDRVMALVAEDVGFAVPTDHNRITDYGPVVADLKAPMGTEPGVEITTKKWGHFNAYPYPAAEFPPPYADIEPAALFALVRDRAPGSIIQVNHPRMGDLGYFNYGKLDSATGAADPALSFDFDTLEVFNGFDLNSVDKVEGYLREWLALMAVGHRYTGVGSSDSHKIAFQWAGYPRTYVRVSPGLRLSDATDAVMEALRGGRAMVTNGPFIDAFVEGEGPGGTVAARAGRVRLHVEVHAPPWIDVSDLRVVLVDGTQSLAAQRGGGSMKLSFEGEIAVARDTYLVVLARGSTPMEDVLAGAGALPFAFTNPIWIDTDGDGAVKLK